MEVTDKLISILKIVSDHLKFAEAKNAILLAFSGTGITAVLTYLSAVSNIPKLLQTCLLTATFFLCLSSLISAISFLPKINLEHIVWLQGKPTRKLRKLQEDSDNFYYFNDLRKYNSAELLDSINRLYFEKKIQLPYKKEYLDIVNQIVINAEIASIKFKLFAISLWLLILLSTSTLLVLIYIICRSL